MWFRRLLKAFLVLLVSVTGVLILLFILINLPFSIRFCTKQVNAILHKADLPVTVESLGTVLPTSVNIQGLKISDLQSDTIVYTERLRIVFAPLALLNRKIILHEIYLEQARVYLNRLKNSDRINIVETFSSGKNAKNISVQGGFKQKWDLSLGNAKLSGIRFVMDDSVTGLHIRQKVDEINVKTKKMSLINRNVLISSLEIKGLIGSIRLTGIPEVQKVANRTLWDLGLYNLSLTDIDFTFNDQPRKSMIKVILKEGNFRVNNSDINNGIFDLDEISISQAIASLSTDIIPVDSKSSENIASFNFPFVIKCRDLDLENIKFDRNRYSGEKDSPDSPFPGIKDLDTRLTDIKINRTDLAAVVKKLNLDLNNGFSVKKLKGELNSHPGNTSLNLALETGFSSINLEAISGKSLFNIIAYPSELNNSSIKITDSFLNLRDIFILKPSLEGLPLLKTLGNDPVKIEFNIGIKDSVLNLSAIRLEQAGNFTLSLNGEINNTIRPENAYGELKFKLNGLNSHLLKEILEGLAPSQQFLNLNRISVEGTLTDSLKSPRFNLSLQSDIGNLSLQGFLDFNRDKMLINSTFKNLLPGKILNIPALGSVSGSGEFSGSGFKKRSFLGKVVLNVDSLLFNDYCITNTKVECELNPSFFDIELSVYDPALGVEMNTIVKNADSLLTIESSSSFFAKLNDLNLIKDTLSISGKLLADFQKRPGEIVTNVTFSDMKFTAPHKNAGINKISLLLNTDSVRSGLVATGEFFNGKVQIERPLWELGDIAKEYKNYLNSFIDSLRRADTSIAGLPEANATFNITYHPAIGMIFQDSSIHFTSLDFTLNNRITQNRINYNIRGKNLSYEAFKTGLLDVTLIDSAGKLNLKMDVLNSSFNSIPMNRILLESQFEKWQSLTRFTLIDKTDKVVYDLDLSSELDGDDMVFKIPSKKLILNGTRWMLDNPDFLTFGRSDKTIRPSLNVHTDNSYLSVQSHTDRGMTSYTCKVNNVSLLSLVHEGMLPGKPAAIMSGSILYGVSGDGEKRLSTEMDISDIFWSGLTLDNIGIRGSLRTNKYQAYKIDMEVQLDSSKIAITGEKPADGTRVLNAGFTDIPVSLIQPLVRDYISEAKGKVSGELNISSKGKTENYSGEIKINGASIKVNSLNSKFIIPGDMLVFSGNKLLLKKFTVRDSLNNELLVDGSLDFSNNKEITADLEISASRLQVMNTSETDNNSFYGKIYIDSRLQVKGPLRRPILRGTILLSDGTVIFYRQKEDLSVSESEKIVRFATSDTIVNIHSKTLNDLQISNNNLSVETVVEIDPATMINIILPERLYHIELMIKGGGTMNYSMLVNNRNNLAGRYEISEGSADVKMIGWPNKAFRITPGGYIRWDGNIEDPEINFEALNRVRSSYTNPVDGKNRNVDFNVALKLTGLLSDLNVLFTINTPDQYLMSIINTLSPEEQMRQAITILLFQKVDLPGISTSSDYMTEQVNQLVATQLNQLTKTTIKGLDISFGIDSYKKSTLSGGQETKTSLSYEVKHSLLNNRAQIEFSGRLNDINKQPGTADLSLNNFSFEYRLDSAGTKFLKVFNEHTYEDVFEGEVIKTGIGMTFRKSYRFLGDIWKRERRSDSAKGLTK